MSSIIIKVIIIYSTQIMYSSFKLTYYNWRLRGPNKAISVFTFYSIHISIVMPRRSKKHDIEPNNKYSKIKTVNNPVSLYLIDKV